MVCGEGEGDLMRTLTATLQTAQRSSSRRPYIRCVVDDQPPSMPRWAWTSLYTGTEEDNVNDAAVGQSLTIHRVRLATDGAGGWDVWYQRVTDPTVAGQWSAWTKLVQTVGADTVAVAAASASSTVIVFWVSTSGLVVRAKRSTDDGVTWGGVETVYTFVAGLVRAVAADWAEADNHVVFSFDPLGADPDDYLLVSKYQAGAWQAPFADVAQRYTAIRSLGVARFTDARLYIVMSSGVDPELDLGIRRYDTDTDTFADTYAVLAGGSGSGFGYRYPKVRAPTVAVPHWFYTYNEQAVLEYFNWIVCSKDHTWLGQGVPVSATTSYGLKLLQRSGYWYVVGCKHAFRTALYAGVAGDVLDVGASVRYVQVEEPRASAGADLAGPMHGSRVVVRLDNAAGTYAGAGSGNNRPLREASRLALGLGYVTTAGNESVWWAPFWVEGVAYDDRKGEGLLEITAIDAWEYLDRVYVARLVSFTSASLQAILRRALWPVCDVGAANLHANLGTTVPLFTFQPSETFGGIARRALKLAGLGLRFKATGAAYGWNTVGVDVYAYGAGASGYSYGPAAHVVESARGGSGSQLVNGVYVAGSSAVQAFRYDYTHAHTVGALLMARVFDKQWDTAGECQGRGDRALEVAQAGGSAGLLVSSANVGVELGDVVDVTDSRAGLAAALRRVVGIETVYDYRRGIYKQDLRLVGV